MANFNESTVEYDAGGTPVKLSPNIIRRYLVSGRGNVSDSEIVMFLNLCRAQRLNPFLREAYLIKFSDDLPATIVVGKDVFTKRAAKRSDFAGMEAGVVVVTVDGEVINRPGSIVFKGETLVGAWARVYIKGYSVPIEDAVSMDEYFPKRQLKPSEPWARMPATMIRKVAVVHALREAFPEDLQGLYDASEMNVNTNLLETKPVEIGTAATEDLKQLTNESEEMMDDTKDDATDVDF